MSNSKNLYSQILGTPVWSTRWGLVEKATIDDITVKELKLLLDSWRRPYAKNASKKVLWSTFKQSVYNMTL